MAQRHVWAALVVMSDPPLQHAPQVCCGYRDEPVQALSSDRPDHPLADRVRHRAVRRCLEGLQPNSLNDIVQLAGEDAVAIVNQVLVSSVIPERVAQLLARPARTRVCGDIAVNQSPRLLLDDYEYVQQPKRTRHGNEEVAGHDRLRMVSEECRPALVASGTAGRGCREIFPHRPRRDSNTEFQPQLIGDPLLAP